VADVEQMTLDERLKYLRLIQPRYLQFSRPERTALLTEAEQVTHLARKTLIRRLHGNLTRKPRRRQRGRTYGREVEAVVRLVAETLDFPCAERLQPVLPAMAAHLAQHGELDLSPRLVDHLGRISVSTVTRMLRHLRRDQPQLARQRPVQTNPLTRHVPAGRIARCQAAPGHVEADLVHHAGPSSDGLYVHTLQLVDVATGWSERVAILGRSYLVMRDAFTRILARLPFPLLEIHPDNGGEFFNHFLMTYWRETLPQATLSRSRPYCKNDNPFVEEKNGSAVRAYLGFQRLDTVAQTNLLNQVYDRMWLLHNFFFPVMRLQARQYHPGRSPSRSYDLAQAPFDRLCASGTLPPSRQAELARLRQITNPRLLNGEIHARLARLRQSRPAQPGASQDVRKTLFRTTLQLPDAILPVTLSIDGTMSLR
jgi:hypothetical protein